MTSQSPQPERQAEMMISNSTSRGLNGLELTTASLIGLTPTLIFFGRAPLAVAAICALALILVSRERGAIVTSGISALRSKLGAALAILFLLWLPNISASPDPVHSTTTVLRSGIFLIAALPIWAFLRSDHRRVDIALRALCIASCGFAAIAIIAISWWPQLFNITHLKPLNPISAILAYKQTGSAAVLMIPLAALAAWQSPGRCRIISIAAMILLFAVIIATSSRAGLIGVIAGGSCVGLALILKAKAKRFGIVVLALVIVVLGAALIRNYYVYGEEAPDAAIVFLPTWTVDWHRQTIWATTWQISADSRWFGVGVNAINLLPGAKERIGDYPIMVLAHHPHNWMLEILAETGAISFALMLGIVIFVSIRIWRSRDSVNGPATMAMIAIWVGYWTSGLFNFSYWSSWWMVSFYVCMAIAVASEAGNTASSVKAPG